MSTEADTQVSTRAPRAARSHVGERVGHYLVGELIGRGAGGDVYRGNHLYLRRKAAIKFVQPKGNGALDRFLAEARDMAALRHPGLVEIYDCALMTGDSAWLAMELLEGESLAERLRRDKRLTLEEIVDIIGQLADALEAVHDAGLVHRDLKPANVFLIGERGQLRVKLLDFGVAKHLEAPVRTAPGALLGTPYYMSPEQCRGEATVDRRSDVYSLGALLFELAAGRPPFVGRALADLIDQHIHESPPSLRELAPGLPPVVAEVAACALQKSPDDRFPCALALAKELETAVEVAVDTRRQRPPTERMAAAAATELDGPTTVMAAAPVMPAMMETPPPAARPFPRVTLLLAALVLLLAGMLAGILITRH
jgi:eukaryotic-like serine/threonine-protein kinase